jgi:hypothetical protein
MDVGAWAAGLPAGFEGAATRALEAVRVEAGVRRTALFWLETSTGSLRCVATAGGSGSETWLGQRLAAGLGMAGRAVAEGRPLWTADLLTDPRVPIAPWLRACLEREGLHVVAAAPVRAGDRVRGALGFLDGPGRTFDEATLQALGRLADAVAAQLVRADA